MEDYPQVKVRIDREDKIIYGSEPICNRHVYSEMKEVIKENVDIPWMFNIKDEILGSDDISVTIRHSFELVDGWIYKQEK